MRYILPILLACVLSLGPPPVRSAFGEAEAEKAAPHASAAKDAYGDPLPAGALGRLGTIRLQHLGEIVALTYSADGKTILSVGKEGTVRVWQAEDGKRVRLFRVADRIEHASFSRTGDRVVLLLDSDIVCVLDTTGNTPPKKFSFDSEGWLRKVALSPDGKRMATASDEKVSFWDADTGEPSDVRCWDSKHNPDWKPLEAVRSNGVLSRSFRADGNVMAQARYNDSVWLYWSGGASGPDKLPTQDVLVRFAPNGMLLTSQGCDTIAVWDASLGKQVLTIPITPHRITDMAMSPDGKRIVAGSRDGSISCYDAQTGSRTFPRSGHPPLVVAASADGKWLATSDSAEPVRIWFGDTFQEKSTYKVTDPKVLVAALSGLEFSPDGSKLFAVTSRANFLFRVSSGECLLRREEHSLSKQIIRFMPTGNAIIALSTQRPSFRHGLRALNLAEGIVRDVGHPPFAEEIQGNPAALVLASDETRLYASTSNPDIYVYDAGTGKELQVLRLSEEKRPVRREREFGPLPAVQALALTPDGRTLLAGHPEFVLFWDLVTGKQLFRVNVTLTTLALSPDGKLIACARPDGSVEVWEMGTRTKVGVFAGHEGGVTYLTFVANGRRLVSGSQDHTALVWDVPAVAAEAAFPQGNGWSVEVEEDMWQRLGGDTPTAYAAMRAIVRQPAPGVKFLRARLRVATPLDAKSWDRWLAKLDHEEFTVRQKAFSELRELGEEARPRLQEVLRQTRSAEVRRQAENLLEALDERQLTEQQLRDTRSIQALEWLNNVEACTVLRKLAEGRPQSYTAIEARASLERLGQK